MVNPKTVTQPISHDSQFKDPIMSENEFANLKATLRGELITRADEQAHNAARFRGWNHDLNTRADPLGFVIASGGEFIRQQKDGRPQSSKLA